jgi:hypothetical protein
VRARRVLVWILTLPVAIVLSAALSSLRMPDAPWQLVVGIGVVLWPVLGFAIDGTMTAQAAAFEAVTSGDLQRAEALLAKRGDGFWSRVDVYGTAAVEIFLGRAHAARARMAREPAAPFGPAARLRKTVEAHASLVERGGAMAAFVLRALLTTGKLGLPLSERYRMLLVAMAALTPNPLERTPEWTALVDEALVALASHRDEHVRAYAEWVRAARDVPPPPEVMPETLRRSAALARGHRLLPLATRIDGWATERERALVGAGPYRG